VQSLRRYGTLFGLFMRSSLLTRLEYRADFVVGLTRSIFWSVVIVAGVLVLFRFTPTLGGWTMAESLLVVGLFYLFFGLIECFLQPNIVKLVEHIAKGTFDFIVLKPVDSQFFASLREQNLPSLCQSLSGLALLGYATATLERTPSLGALLAFAVLLSSGIVIAYALWMLLVTTAFWLVRIENIAELLFVVFEAGRFPVSAFSAPVQALLTFVVPVAFMTTFPAAALAGRLTTTMLVAAPLLSIALLLLSRRFWRLALRNYSSASS
jgi:ABC-2 type transport system permease protein